MEKGIIVIGQPHVNLEERLRHHANTVIVSEPEQAKQVLQQIEPIPFRARPEPPIIKIRGEGKEFVCKGKHRYRLVKTVKQEMENGSIEREIWACQCGKTL